MSQLKVNSVVDASGGNTATINTYTPTESNMGGKNRIINGDMRIDQRNAGASVNLTSNGVYPVDRWRCDEFSAGAATGEQVQDFPSGFTDSLKITTTTADGSLLANYYLGINQFIEGYNTADFGFGTASAKTITLSFWVKSSLTGTFAGGLDNENNSRSYVFNYTINSANTWEYKTVSIAGDTTGTWGTTNGRGVSVRFALGAGTDYNGTVGAWQSGLKFSSSGAVSVIGTLNATWYITGAQLEVGSVATPFERRDYGRELMLCQRYYLPVTSSSLAYGRGNSTGGTVCSLPIPVPLRATPTLPSTTTAYLYSVSGYSGAATATWSNVTLASNSVIFQGAGFSGGTDNRPNLTELSSGFYFSAEL